MTDISASVNDCPFRVRGRREAVIKTRVVSIERDSTLRGQLTPHFYLVSDDDRSGIPDFCRI